MIIRLRLEGDTVVAVIHAVGHESIAGYGETVPEALRDLAGAIQYLDWPLPEGIPTDLPPVRVN